MSATVSCGVGAFEFQTSACFATTRKGELRSHAADPDRGIRLLNRLRLRDRGVELVEATLEGRTLLGPERLQNGAGLVHHSDAVRRARERHPVHLEFGLVPCGADAHLEPPRRQMVDGHGDLREQTRVTIGIAGHIETDPRALGVLRDGAEDRPPVEDELRRVIPEGDEVVERPDVVEARLVRDAPRLALRIDGVDLLRKLQADAKWMRHHTEASVTTMRACAPMPTAGSVRCQRSSPRIARYCSG